MFVGDGLDCRGFHETFCLVHIPVGNLCSLVIRTIRIPWIIEAFWILGLLNNFLWVVMNAGAGSINEVRFVVGILDPNGPAHISLFFLHPVLG